MAGSRRNDDSGAASTVVAFLVAGVIFVGSVGAILLTSRDSTGHGASEGADAAKLDLQAEALADVLVGSPGFHTVQDAQGASYVEGWDATTADALGRLGLRDEGDARMDFDKFQNLRRAGLAHNTGDGLVNYPDARDSLGLADTDLDFHVRAFPSLSSVREVLATGNKDPNLRVTYIADYVKLTGGATPVPTLGALSCAVSGSVLTLSLPITNSGSTTTSFTGQFSAMLGTGTKYEDRTRTFELPSGASGTLSLDVPATAGRTCSGTVSLELRDVKSKLGTYSYTLSAGSTPSSTVTKDLWANPGRTYYTQGQAVTVEFDGDLPTKSSDPSVTLSLSVTRSDGTLVYGPVSKTVTKSVRTFTVPATAFNSAVTHQYVATLSYPAAGTVVKDNVIVVPSTSPPTTIAEYTPMAATVSYTADASVVPEAQFLDELVEKFCPYLIGSATTSPLSTYAAADYGTRCAFKSTTPLNTAQPGDIIPDQQDELNDALPLRLVDPDGTNPDGTPYTQKCNGNIEGAPRYDIARVLVVGSNVDHNSMTSAVAKYAVCEWVMGGGTLIVFGSAEQRVQWLEPIFKAAITSSSAPVSTPDASHPILNRADVLAYDGYDTNGQVWSFNGQTALNQADLLTNVVQSGAADSLLTISNPGAFGDGTVILTTWLPYDLFGTGAGTSTLEGLKVVNNFLMQGYRDLFLDYGPSIPHEARAAAAAQRVVDIWHPEFTSVQAECADPSLVAGLVDATHKACYEPITLTVFVYVF